jgi:hypothetical protein
VQVRTVEPDEQIAMEVLSSPRAMQFFRALIEIFQALPKKKSPATSAPDLARSAEHSATPTERSLVTLYEDSLADR